jgi:hypothetical protein
MDELELVVRKQFQKRSIESSLTPELKAVRRGYCPKCQAGRDGETLGPVWDPHDHCFICVICRKHIYIVPAADPIPPAAKSEDLKLLERALQSERRESAPI